MDRSESPSIPSFSTAGAVNGFPSRKLSSISKSSKAREPCKTPRRHSASGIGAISLSINRSSVVIVKLRSITNPFTPPSSLEHPSLAQPPTIQVYEFCRPLTFLGTRRPPSLSATLPASSTQAGDALAPSSSFLPRLQVEGADVGEHNINFVRWMLIRSGRMLLGRRSESHPTTSSDSVKS
ncbi:hypothetical protein GALMADRAFT_1140326 [Galerina marginata CBS 339.88]|uniref:Uncharacterized protein n=1 Tax=Galerina marginata (strain CBS 339.88) TaxID=685588 RepID=A0A067S7D3_GALM3|nr:hypothetical protein GALMADRAFT_1140326 [Galerina marginata CBS 339.88]